jgi:hypothetical protein
MNNQANGNTLGIPTAFTIGLDTNSMIFIGIVVTAFIFHKVIVK